MIKMLKMRSLFLQFGILASIPIDSFAESLAGRVVSVRGEAFQVLDGKKLRLEAGTEVREGSVIQTLPGASLKIFMTDQTTLSLGPDSKVSLDDLSHKSAGNIELVNGQLRSRVVKEMIGEANTAQKIKFVIRTKSAVMGVRGTDFEVLFNQKNLVTSLVTFEGSVAMVKGDPTAPLSALQTSNLLPLLGSEKAIIVPEGKFSTTSPALRDVSIPVKLSPVQFETMKRSEPGAPPPTEKTSESAPSQTKTISPIPPGLDSKNLSTGQTALDKIASTFEKSPNADSISGPLSAPPEGLRDGKTGAFAPPAGGFLDPKTALYIPPPPGSTFDANTGVYNPPASSGKVDPNTGSYTPPAGFQLDPNRGFIPAPQPQVPQQGALPTGPRVDAQGQSSTSSPQQSPKPSQGATNGSAQNLNGFQPPQNAQTGVTPPNGIGTSNQPFIGPNLTAPPQIPSLVGPSPAPSIPISSPTKPVPQPTAPTIPNPTPSVPPNTTGTLPTPGVGTLDPNCPGCPPTTSTGPITSVTPTPTPSAANLRFNFTVNVN